MQNQISIRLQTLKDEFEAGQKMLAELDAKRTDLQQTMLRISGAIQVLEEMLAEEPQPAANGAVIGAESTL